MGCGASSSPGPRVHPEVRAPTDGEGKKPDPMDARVPKKNPCGGSASSVGRVAESDDSRGNSSDGGDSCTVQGDLALAADAQRKDRERRQKTINGGD